jgi:hypothetical protein
MPAASIRLLRASVRRGIQSPVLAGEAIGAQLVRPDITQS